MAENVVLTINIGARCDECKQKGATTSRLCLRCLTKAMNPKARMRSPTGIAYQRQIADHFAAIRKGRG